MSKRRVTAEDVLRLKFAGDPQMSPDGERVVLTLKVVDQEKNKYWSHLWLVDLKGRRLRQFTFGEVLDTSPRWTPDGKRIAFLRTVEKRTQIWVLFSTVRRNAILLPSGDQRGLVSNTSPKVNCLSLRPLRSTSQRCDQYLFFS